MQNKFNLWLLVNYINNLLIYWSLLIAIFWLKFPDKNILWGISWYSLVLLMAIRPLSDIFPKITILKRLIILRKWLWILSAMVIVSQALYTYIPDYSLFISIFFNLDHWWFDRMQFFARMWELTGLILLITSNNFSIRKLWRWWKRVQRLSYIYFYSWWIYIFNLWKTSAMYWMVLVSILWIVAYCKKN